MGKSTINGPFSIAMLNYQRVSSMGLSLRDLSTSVTEFFTTFDSRDGFWGSPSGKIHDLHLKGG